MRHVFNACLTHVYSQAEFDENLARAGSVAEPARLRAALLTTLELNTPTALAQQGLSPPLEAASQVSGWDVHMSHNN